MASLAWSILVICFKHSAGDVCQMVQVTLEASVRRSVLNQAALMHGQRRVPWAQVSLSVACTLPGAAPLRQHQRRWQQSCQRCACVATLWNQLGQMS